MSAEVLRSHAGASSLSGFIVANPQMVALLATASRAAASEGKVLITGESGVGKDLVARHIHAHSRRSGRPFVAVNCAAMTDSLLESELFGHVKGSFTGAYRDKPGKLQVAHRGTIFLDEVGEMSLRMQAMLLRFLENGEIQSVGSDGHASHVDVRVVAATNRNLSELIAAGQFREDLMYRLRVIHLEVPPLRERRDDIPPLVEYFVNRTGRSVRFGEAAMQLLIRHRWPGNVRELVRRGLSTTRGNYRALLKLFGMAPADYKRFLNFLAAHDCRADFREFRNGAPEMARRPELMLPALQKPKPLSAESPLASVG